jgi:hypothetical protein
MKKLQSAVLIALVLSSTFTFLSFSFSRVVAGSNAPSLLEYDSYDNWQIMQDAVMNLNHYVNIPSSPLADLYRQTLGASNTSVEEKVPIPENASVIPSTVVGENSTGGCENFIPVRQQFYQALAQDYASSFGLDAVVVNSSMVPNGSLGECRIYAEAMASPRVLDITPSGSHDVWTLGIGPANSSRFAEYMFTQTTFVKMFLEQLGGEQVYMRSSSIMIGLPTNGTLMNGNELSGLNWKVDLGGGNLFEASVSVGEQVLLNETMFVTNQNTTLPLKDLGNAFQGFGSFRIEYSVAQTGAGDPQSQSTSSQVAQSFAAGKLGSSAGAAGNAVVPGDFSWSYSFAFPPMHKSDQIDNEPSLTYDANLKLVATYSISWDPTLPIFSGLTSFRSTVRFDAEANLTVTAKATIPLVSWDIQIFSAPAIPPITFLIGPVPVSVVLGLTAHATGSIVFSVGPSVSAGYNATGWLEYGVQYQNGAVTPVWDHAMTGQFIPPTKTDAEIDAEITAGVSVVLQALFYGVVGPKLIVGPYVTAVFSFPIGTQQLTIDVTVGLKISFAFGFNTDLEILLLKFVKVKVGDFTLKEWDYPFFHYIWRNHHDVAITNMELSKNPVYPGNKVVVSATVMNMGTTLQPSDNKEAFYVNFLLDDTTIDTEHVSDLKEGYSQQVSFDWTVPNTSGEHVIKAQLSSITPAEETDGNDYSINNAFNRTVTILAIDFGISLDQVKTWYMPGEKSETILSVINVRKVPTSFSVKAIFMDIKTNSYEGPQSVRTTLAPGQIATFTLTWTIPNDAPFGLFQVNFICGDDTGQQSIMYRTNATWADDFYVYGLKILPPTNGWPESAGDPNNPSVVSVRVAWIPAELSSLTRSSTVFSVTIGNKPAKCELDQSISVCEQPVGDYGQYILKVTSPTQQSEGLYDLTVTAALDQLTDSAKQPNAISYVTGQPTEPIQKGLAWLRTRQYSDGSWLDSVGITSLDALAFINQGYGESDPTVNKAVAFVLSRAQSDGSIWIDYWHRTYETSLAVILLVSTHNNAYKSTIEAAKNWLVNSQWDESFFWGSIGKDDWRYGGFGYGEGERPDLSNTQFALLALDAAGLPKSDPVWARVQVFLARCQNINFSVIVDISGTPYTVNPYNQYGGSNGGFIYQPGNSLAGGQTSYGSMTGAGIWGLLLAGVGMNDPRFVAAFNWVSHNYGWEGNPGMPNPTNMQYYYYLSMAKALTMTTSKTVNGHDWYQDLYNKLNSIQNPSGYWYNPNGWVDESLPELATAYSILALQTRTTPPPFQRLSYLTFILRSNCLLSITDPEGNLVGYNYTAGGGENNIPTVPLYSGPNSEPQFIVIFNPEPGTYSLELVGISEGPYNLTIQGNYGEEVTKTYEFTGDIRPAEIQGSNLTVTAIVGPIDIYANHPEYEMTIDNVPPTTNLTIGNPKYVDPSGNVYVALNTPFTLAASDTGSGVNSTGYEITNSKGYNSGWLTYTGPFELISLRDGNYTIAFNSTDNAGNVENTNYLNVTLVGPDVNGDGKVDILDAIMESSAFGSSLGQPTWNPIFDINFDGVVNILDMILIAGMFGKTYL